MSSRLYENFIKENSKCKSLWASTRMPFDYVTAIDVKSDIITMQISHIEKLKMFGTNLNDYSNDLINFSVICSKGTYIRVLGSDIAKKMNTVGHLIKLVRTSIGSHEVSNALTIEDFEKRWKYLEQ